jgi:hypothetical protein
MADKLCPVIVVFKSGERVNVWMSRNVLDTFTADYANHDGHSVERKIYPLAVNPASATPDPVVLGLSLADVAYIA